MIRSKTVPPKVCFILGMEQRTGTNYLHALLSRHPYCRTMTSAYEDYLLTDSHLLTSYLWKVRGRWNNKWKVEEKCGPIGKLHRAIGEQILSYLTSDINLRSPAIILTKTPSVVNIDNFPRLFPGCPLILLVRDGRSTIESGVVSFGWNYEEAIHGWVNSAERLLNFIENKRSKNKFIVVKYEDLVLNTEFELKRIFSYLNLSSKIYDFGSALNQKVIGSSELKKGGTDLHWTPVEKTPSFDPVNRHANWDRHLISRYDWLAGKHHRKLGYDLDTPKHNLGSSVFHHVLDFFWKLRKAATAIEFGLQHIKALYFLFPKSASFRDLSKNDSWLG